MKDLIDFCEHWLKNHYAINVQEHILEVYPNSDFTVRALDFQFLQELNKVQPISKIRFEDNVWLIMFS